MGKNSKRSKSYYIQNAKRCKRDFDLSSTTKGFLCTCSTMEKDCVRETYNILNHAANQLYGKELSADKVSEEKPKIKAEEADSSSDESVDLDAELKKEVSSLQTVQKDEKKSHRFKQVFSGARNCIFISTTVEEPLDVSIAVMERIIESKEHLTKHLIRMIPVQRTCKAYYENIEKAAKELISQNLPDRPVTFCVVFRSRNNNSIAKDSTLLGLAKLFTEFNKENTTSYHEAEFVLNVEIIKNLCCLSILPFFFGKYCRYNLVSIADNVIPKQNDSKIKVEDSSITKGIEDSSTIHDVPSEENSEEQLRETPPNNVEEKSLDGINTEEIAAN